VIDPAQPTPDEKELLLQHLRKSSSPRIRERAHAILLSSQRYSPYQISQILFRGEKTVREWIKLFHGQRIASLFPKYYGNQNAAKLTSKQKEEIAKVLSQPPSDESLPKRFWDVKSLSSYVKAEFGVVYESVQSYHFLFKISNYSFKLPGRVDKKRDERKVSKQLAQLKKVLKPLLQDPGWVVVAGDETRLVWEALLRRAWLPKGQKTIIKVERENQFQNFLGFLNLKTGQPHLFKLSWQNQTEMIRVLRLFQRSYPGKKICLVWDNAGWHKGRSLREKLKVSLKSYFLLNFPPHAPDTNPQEHIWQWSKGGIANEQFASMLELVKVFRRVVMSRKYPYQI